MVLDLQGVAFAFTAGAFSLLSPCGYALLPGYISYYLGSERSVGKALSSGFACTTGIIAVFAVIGGLASSLGVLVSQLIPVLDLVAGAVVILMGIIMLTGIELPPIPLRTKTSKRKGLIGLFAFGIAYGLAAVGCSAPIFFSILFYAMAKGLISGTVTFIAYAVGMGVPLIVTSLLVAEAKEIMIRKITNATVWFQKIGGILLIIIGIYLFYFYYSTYVAS